MRTSSIPSVVIVTVMLAVAFHGLLEEGVAAGDSRYDSAYLRIYGNDELLSKASSMGWEGDGTEKDPIIIKDFSIEMDERYSFNAISLQSTDLHVVLMDLVISYCECGLFINNCENVTLENIQISDCSKGIEILNSFGIHIENTLIEVCSLGIRCDGSQKISTSQMRISDCGIGLNLERNTGQIKLLSSVIDKCTTGVYCRDNAEITIDSTTISNCSGNGLYSRGDDKITVEACTITYSSTGIYFRSGSEILVNSSRFIMNFDIGLSISYWVQVQVTNNTFMGSSLYLYYMAGLMDLAHLSNNTLNGNHIEFIYESIVNKTLSGLGEIHIQSSENIEVINGFFTRSKTPVYVMNSKNITFRECRFDRTIDSGFNVYSTENLKFINCSFNSNEGSTGEIQSTIDIEFENCTFEENEGSIKIIYPTGELIFNNNTFSGDVDFLYLSNIDRLHFNQCKFTSNGFGGIFLISANELKIKDSQFIGSGLWTYYNMDEMEFTIINTTVNNKRMMLIKDMDMAGQTIDEDIGQLFLCNVSGLTLKDLELGISYLGIMIYKCNNITVENILIDSGRNGIYSRNSEKIVIRNSSIRNSGQSIFIVTGKEVHIHNCILNGPKGHRTADYWWSGIHISFVETASIENNTISDTVTGIDINKIETGNVSGNRINNCRKGIAIVMSIVENTYIRNNDIENCREGGIIVSAWGYHFWNNRLVNCSFGFYDHLQRYEPEKDLDISENNTVNGLPIHYRFQEDVTITKGEVRGQYIGIDCHSYDISDMDLIKASHGIILAYCTIVNIRNCRVSGFTSSGIHLVNNLRNTIQGNHFENNDCGLNLTCEDDKDYTFDISDNTFYQENKGIFGQLDLSRPSNLECHNNLFYECEIALNMPYQDGGHYFENDIIGSERHSIYSEGMMSLFYRNNFYYNLDTGIDQVEGSYHGVGPNEVSIFDPDDDESGNYWSDNCRKDIDDDGIIDRKYRVNDPFHGYSLFDHYPLTKPCNSKHLVIDHSGNSTMINLTWELPEYYILGNITSLILHRVSPLGIDVILDNVTGNLSYHEINLDEMKNYTYYIVPTFEKGIGYPSNSISVLHDGAPPDLKIIYPKNGTIYQNGNEPYIEWEVDNEEYALLFFRFKVNDNDWQDVDYGRRVIFYRYSGAEGTLSQNKLSYGINKVKIEATDTLNQTTQDEVWIIIDNERPEIEILTPTNRDTYGSSVFFSWIITDEFSDITSISIAFDGNAYFDVTGTNEYWAHDLTLGFHVFNIRAMDEMGNERFSKKTFDILDDTIDIKITSPLTGSMFKERKIQLTWQIENRMLLENVLISIDGAFWEPVNEYNSINLTFDSDGMKNIILKAVNIQGKEYFDQVNISIDSISPQVIYISPIGMEVPVDTMIIITFSELMNQSSVKIFVDSWVATIFWDGERAILNYPGAFEYNKEISIEIHGKDLFGNSMEPHEHLFRTTDKGTVGGRVVDEERGPLSGVRILLDNGQETLTDDNGYFSLEVPQGRYSIQITREGYSDVISFFNIAAGDDHNIGEIVLSSNQVAEPEKSDNGLLIAISILVSLIIAAVIIGYFVYVVRKDRKFRLYLEE